MCSDPDANPWSAESVFDADVASTTVHTSCPLVVAVRLAVFAAPGVPESTDRIRVVAELQDPPVGDARMR
jgi:hypothetical protein